jgi:hypothetical protein
MPARAGCVEILGRRSRVVPEAELEVVVVVVVGRELGSKEDGRVVEWKMVGRREGRVVKVLGELALQGKGLEKGS